MTAPASTGYVKTGKALREPWRALTSLPWRVIRAHPLTVALVVFIIYGASVWLSFGIQHEDPRVFATIGTQFLQKGGAASPLIQHDALLSHPSGAIGFDGQFSYYIAMDPLHAAPYIDDPALRYERILYPLVARAVALGNPALIPYTLVTVNWFAMVAGTLAVAMWLRRRGLSTWIALVFGLFPGLFFAFRHDLTEPLGFAFVAWGVVALELVRPHARLVVASICFALAMLAREATLFVSLPFIVALAWPEITAITARDWAKIRPGVQRAGLVLAASVGPYLAWKVALYRIFGVWGFNARQHLPLRAPFAGLLPYWPLNSAKIETQISFVVIPGLIALIAVVFALLKARRGWSAATVAMLINALYLCVFLAPDSYIDYSSSGRIQSGLVLAAIFALPVFDSLWRQSRGWFWAASALWLAPLWHFGLQPLVEGYLHYGRHLL